MHAHMLDMPLVQESGSDRKPVQSNAKAPPRTSGNSSATSKSFFILYQTVRVDVLLECRTL